MVPPRRWRSESGAPSLCEPLLPLPIPKVNPKVRETSRAHRKKDFFSMEWFQTKDIGEFKTGTLKESDKLIKAEIFKKKIGKAFLSSHTITTRWQYAPLFEEGKV